jgi:hypothetical protein
MGNKGRIDETDEHGLFIHNTNYAKNREMAKLYIKLYGNCFISTGTGIKQSVINPRNVTIRL